MNRAIDRLILRREQRFDLFIRLVHGAHAPDFLLALASQARKYGLGLVFATQAPKGLHNRIPGNAATQFFGLLNSPTQITAAREMARADISDDGITELSVYCTGDWDTATRAEHAAAVTLIRP